MIDNRIFISSAILINEMYNDFNLQSDDFVTRVPIWVANALEELNFYQAYITLEKDIEFDDYRCELPYEFKGILDVYINNKKANLRNIVDIKDKIKSDDIVTVSTYTPYTKFEDNNIRTVKNNKIINNNNQPDYYISNGWLHTNVSSGIVHIKYKAIPIVYDSIVNMDVPLIYNHAQLKRYLKFYCMKQILMRGYKHPVFNLTTNNPYTNPALEVDRIRVQTRVACNKFSKDRRNNISSILTSLEYK